MCLKKNTTSRCKYPEVKIEWEALTCLSDLYKINEGQTTAATLPNPEPEGLSIILDLSDREKQMSARYNSVLLTT